MAVADRPNSVFIMDALVADLRLIKRANNYWSDVADVDAPEFPPTSLSQAFSMKEYPALLVWLSYMRQSQRTGDSLGGDLRSELGVFVVGIVKQERGLQTALLTLAEDVKRCMRLNAGRDYPGLAIVNTWGINTDYGSGGFKFDYSSENGVTFGHFSSEWVISYRFPTPKG